MFRDVISDETWTVIGLLSSIVKAAGRPPVDRRTVVEAAAWRFPDGCTVAVAPNRMQLIFDAARGCIADVT